MATGVACGLQNRHGAHARPGWVRFPHVPAIRPCVPAARALLATLLLAASALTPAGRLVAQEPVPPPPSEPTPGDTLPSAAAAVQDSTPPTTPLGAFVRSLVLPGWGQTVVGRPFRGAVYFGAEAASLFMVFKAQSKLAAARRAEPPNEDLVDARSGERENWIVLSAFIAFLSGLDAWVSTQFWDFEPAVAPADDGSAELRLTVRVPLGFP